MRSFLPLAPLLAAPMLLSACGGDSLPTACATAHCQSLTFVTKTMEFAKHTDPVGQPTVVDGFNLDGLDTVDEQSGCYQPDQTDPNGVTGIDNNAAKLFELIAGFTDNAVEGLLQMAINQGQLLLVLRLEGVDDWQNDDHVTVRVVKGTGVPQLATDGLIAPNQTFEIDPSIPSTIGQGRIVNGRFEGGPFEAVMPFNIFEVSAALRLHNCLVRGTITPEGEMVDVLVGGGVEISQIYEIATVAGANDHNARSILNLLPYVLDPSADLAPNADDVCEQLSAALSIQTQPAYLLGDPFRQTP